MRGPLPSLRVYLLGATDFEAALALQHALADQVAHDRRASALVLCEHGPLITVGRNGGPGDIRCDHRELQARGWRVRWVNRGGGCLLHLPGQLSAYPILPLDRLGLGVEAYLAQLHRVVLAVLNDFNVRGEARPGQPGVWVGDRAIAAVGVAVRDWVAYHGLALNVEPDLVPFRMVRTGAPADGPMTSLARERRGPLRPALARERFVEHFTRVFGFADPDVFFSHPALSGVGASASPPSPTDVRPRAETCDFRAAWIGRPRPFAIDPPLDLSL
jgi:lipoyl(octanoyl) transferase